MTITLLALAVSLAGALAALAAGRSDRAALGLGTTGGLVAAGLAIVAALDRLVGGAGDAGVRLVWAAPIGSVHLGVDALSAWFLLCIGVVSGVACLYGYGYLRRELGHRRLAPPAAFFDVLLAAMIGVTLARDAVSLLVAWEVMTVSSYFLVTFESEREEVRRAGVTYLVASQLGVALLFLALLMLGRHAGALDFASMTTAGAPPPREAAIVVVAAIVGFGAKAGFWPVHVWLPDAHPAAPSHVSAVMSGVMIELGLYGLLRILGLLGEPRAWWGYGLLGIGVVSAFAGIVLSLAQRDLKRLLAYSSVENVGLVAMALGLATIGRAHGSSAVAVVGTAAALLHVLGHGLMKGLLFQAAGSVLAATGTRDLDALGGLGKRMPLTSAAFLVGGVAIAGLPPLAGFVSEWLIAMAALSAGAALPASAAVSAVSVVPVLAIVAGLAAATFAKAWGIVFLGLPRTDAGREAREGPFSMRLALGAGIAGVALFGLWPGLPIRLCAPVVRELTGIEAALVPPAALVGLGRAFAVLAGLVLGLALLRRWLLRGRDVRRAPTWGCGYEAPTPRMQYTSGSFAELLLLPFARVVRRSVERSGPDGPFPRFASFRENLEDPAGSRLLLPAVRRVVGAFGRVRVLQHGRLHLYLVYVLVTLIALLVWQLA